MLACTCNLADPCTSRAAPLELVPSTRVTEHHGKFRIRDHPGWTSCPGGSTVGRIRALAINTQRKHTHVVYLRSYPAERSPAATPVTRTGLPWSHPAEVRVFLTGVINGEFDEPVPGRASIA